MSLEQLLSKERKIFKKGSHPMCTNFTNPSIALLDNYFLVHISFEKSDITVFKGSLDKKLLFENPSITKYKPLSNFCRGKHFQFINCLNHGHPQMGMSKDTNKKSLTIEYPVPSPKKATETWKQTECCSEGSKYYCLMVCCQVIKLLQPDTVTKYWM